MDKLSSGYAEVECASAEQVLELVINELLDMPNAYKPEGGGKRYFWPANDQISIYTPRLPEDCTHIEAAIRAYMAYVGTDGHVRFPVKEIKIDHASGCVKIIGDPDRISEMRPLPRR